MEKGSRKAQLLDMLKQEPADVFLNYALAVELQSEQQLEEAQQQFLRTMKLDADYLPCYYQLGQTLEKMEKQSEALEMYKKGLDLAKRQKNQKAVNEISEAIWMLEE
ncbi:MAG: tetratricopeptide repeat protein [Bacteroidia bacterium]